MCIYQCLKWTGARDHPFLGGAPHFTKIHADPLQLPGAILGLHVHVVVYRK